MLGLNQFDWECVLNASSEHTIILEDVRKNAKCSCWYRRYPHRLSNPESLKYETRTSQESLDTENFVTTDGSPLRYNGANFCQLLPLPVWREVKSRIQSEVRQRTCPTVKDK